MFYQEFLDAAADKAVQLQDASRADIPHGLWSDVARKAGLDTKRNDAGTTIMRLLQDKLGTDWFVILVGASTAAAAILVGAATAAAAILVGAATAAAIPVAAATAAAAGVLWC